MGVGGRSRSPAGSGWRSWSPGRRLLVVAVALAAGPVAVGAVPAGLVAIGVGSGPGPLDPRDPSSPDLGVLAGGVAEVPPPGSPQAEVVLRFVGDQGQWDVPTRQGGAFSVELPAGSYTVAALSGEGVCPSRVEVHAGGWQRGDVLWPCRGGGDLVHPPPPPPGAPAPAPPGEPPQPPAGPWGSGGPGLPGGPAGPGGPPPEPHAEPGGLPPPVPPPPPPSGAAAG